MAAAAALLHAFPSDATLLSQWLSHAVSTVHLRAYDLCGVKLNTYTFDHVHVNFDETGTTFYVRTAGGIPIPMTRSTYIMTVHEVPVALQSLVRTRAQQADVIKTIKAGDAIVTKIEDDSDRFADYTINDKDIPEVLYSSDDD